MRRRSDSPPPKRDPPVGSASLVQGRKADREMHLSICPCEVSAQDGASDQRLISIGDVQHLDVGEVAGLGVGEHERVTAGAVRCERVEVGRPVQTHPTGHPTNATAPSCEPGPVRCVSAWNEDPVFGVIG